MIMLSDKDILIGKKSCLKINRKIKLYVIYDINAKLEVIHFMQRPIVVYKVRHNDYEKVSVLQEEEDELNIEVDDVNLNNRNS